MNQGIGYIFHRLLNANKIHRKILDLLLFYLCDDMRMVWPLLRAAARTFQSCCLATKAMDLVGSSRITTGGSPTNATAALNFRLLLALRDQLLQLSVQMAS